MHYGAMFNGQEGSADMFLDFRHVIDRDPYIGDGFMDYLSIGEFIQNDKGCPEGMIVDNNIHFYDIHDNS